MAGLRRINPVPGKIDDRLGRELGLTGEYADLPTYQIVNDAHGAFGLLTSRLVSLEFGEDGERITSDHRWDEVDNQRKELAEGFRTLGNNAQRAAHLTETVREVNKAIDAIESQSRDGGIDR